MTFKTNIESATTKNTKFRKILYTTDDMQLVVMSLRPHEEIGLEKHNGTQFIRVERGSGKAVVSSKSYLLRENSSIIIEANKYHNIIAGANGMKLYTLYSPPQH